LRVRLQMSDEYDGETQQCTIFAILFWDFGGEGPVP